VTDPRADELFGGADPALLARFKEFHLANPSVYETFRAKAEMMLSTGRPKYSAWVIVQVIRWESDLRTKGDVFKVNNDFIALYARLLIWKDPRFEAFFELLQMKPKRRKISREEHSRTGV
jgi:hypothetical protein